MDDWQTGVCFSKNPCANPENNDPGMCDNDPMCYWDWVVFECVESGGENDFCDCVVSHTQRSCDEMGGSWKFPDWAGDCEDCDWVEKECMLPMHEGDCFHGYEDPCAQFFGGGNEHTDWESATHTCTKSVSFSEAGTWGVNSACFELNWEDTPEPSCADGPLQTEETCYCFDCEWNQTSGDCTEWSEDDAGRITDQTKMHDFQEMIYELSGSSGNDECMDFHMIGTGIHLEIKYPEYGQCEVIMLTPVVTPGS
jgi:hypothetical protein